MAPAQGVHTWGDGGNPERTDWRVCSHGLIIKYTNYMRRSTISRKLDYGLQKITRIEHEIIRVSCEK